MSVINLRLKEIDLVRQHDDIDFTSLLKRTPVSYQIDLNAVFSRVADESLELRVVRLKPQTRDALFGYALISAEPVDVTASWWAVLFCPPGIIPSQEDLEVVSIIDTSEKFVKKFG